jgi:hypothetical protein
MKSSAIKSCANAPLGGNMEVEDYKTCEAAITADYDAQSTTESEVVLRLASVSWRVRRGPPAALPQ